MKIPRHLSHKPIIVAEDYDKIDQHFYETTDAKGLSLGYSTWDRKDLSVKMWRHSDIKWSRQSEELPIHRVFDLSILALSSALLIESVKRESQSYLKETLDNEEGSLEIKKYFINNKVELVKKVKEMNRLANIFLAME